MSNLRDGNIDCGRGVRRRPDGVYAETPSQKIITAVKSLGSLREALDNIQTSLYSRVSRGIAT